MLIALIDDGINVTIYPGLNLKHDLSVEDDGTIRERGNSENIITDHGTTCARIIAKYAPDAEFCSLRIFHKEKLWTSCKQLVAAMEWCLNARILLIHMSVGSRLVRDFQAIRSIVAKILHQRQVIVAACSNKTAYSIPACLGGVFGISADKQMIDDEYKILFSNSGTPTIFASSRHKLYSPMGTLETTPVTNSYAAPTITAKIHNLVVNNAPLSMSTNKIFRSLSGGDVNPQFMSPDLLENALICNPYGYPIDKTHFFFNVVQEKAKNVNKFKRCDLVFLAPRSRISENRIWPYIQANHEKYENIVYCGNIQLPEIQMRWDNFFWSEDALNNQQYQDRPLPPTMVCPIINIYGSDIKAIILLCKLRDLYLKDGYQCCCLSDHPFSYLYGVDYVEKIDCWQKAIENALLYYDPDILINCYQKEELPLMLPEKGDFNIVIEGIDTNGEAVPIPTIDNWVATTASFTRRDIILLYKKIAKYYS